MIGYEGFTVGVWRLDPRNDLHQGPCLLSKETFGLHLRDTGDDFFLGECVAPPNVTMAEEAARGNMHARSTQFRPNRAHRATRVQVRLR